MVFNLLVSIAVGLVLTVTGFHSETHKSLAFLTRPFVIPTLQDFAILIVMGAFAAFAMVCFVNAYKLAPSSFVAPFEYSAMVWSSHLWLLRVRRPAGHVALDRYGNSRHGWTIHAGDGPPRRSQRVACPGFYCAKCKCRLGCVAPPAVAKCENGVCAHNQPSPRPQREAGSQTARSSSGIQGFQATR